MEKNSYKSAATYENVIAREVIMTFLHPPIFFDVIYQGILYSVEMKY